MINSVSVTLNYWFDVEYLDLFTNGKFVLNGLNSTGKTTILKGIEETINSESAEKYQHLVINGEPIEKGVKEMIVYLEKGISVNDIDAVYIEGAFNIRDSVYIINEVFPTLDDSVLTDTLCFFNDQFKKYFPGLIYFKRDNKIWAERWGNKIALDEVTPTEAKVLMIFILLAAKKYMLLLDDFEVGLSLSIQAKILKTMMSFVGKDEFDRPFIISTNSPIVVNEFPEHVQNIKI